MAHAGRQWGWVFAPVGAVAGSVAGYSLTVRDGAKSAGRWLSPEFKAALVPTDHGAVVAGSVRLVGLAI
jgi:hypothetical protein